MYFIGELPPVIKPNTEPNTSADGRKVDWTCADWMIWHKQLVNSFRTGYWASGIKYSAEESRKKANQVFMQWWDREYAWWGLELTTCGYDSQWASYFLSQGLDLRTFLQASTTPIMQGAVDVGEGVQNVTEAAKDTTDVLKILPLGLLALGIFGFVYVRKNYVKGNRKFNFER